MAVLPETKWTGTDAKQCSVTCAGSLVLEDDVLLALTPGLLQLALVGVSLAVRAADLRDSTERERERERTASWGLITDMVDCGTGRNCGLPCHGHSLGAK